MSCGLHARYDWQLSQRTTTKELGRKGLAISGSRPSQHDGRLLRSRLDTDRHFDHTLMNGEQTFSSLSPALLTSLNRRQAS